jgi:hypothetical protein
VPGEIYELDVEIWPTSIVIPAGYRIALSVRGRDYTSQGAQPQPVAQPGRAATSGVQFTGVGPFRHNDGVDRDPAVMGGGVTIHTAQDLPGHLLLPIIPSV